MNTLILTLIYVAVIGLVWLLPLYYVCKWAERNRKDHRIVFLVGFLTGWVIGLIVALLLPALSAEQLAELRKKENREAEPMDSSALIFWGIGVMSVCALGFLAFLKFAL